MIVVDTTILVYAVGADHPLQEPCRRLVRAVAGGELSASTTVEVIQEFVHVRSRRRDRGDAVRLAIDFSRLLAPLLVVGPDDLDDGLALFEETPGLGAFDCVLASTASRAGADGLASADRGFASVEGLRHLDPGAPGFTPSPDRRPQP